MNPSYFRINIPLEEAKERLKKWWNIPEPMEVETHSTEAIDIACNEEGQWRGGAVFFYENHGWSIFEDITGGFSSIGANSWSNFAQNDSFVFAGYNDSIPYGELIVIECGTVKREFMDYPDEPDENKNTGMLKFEEAKPITSWIGVASFVDNDDLAFSEKGWLWVNEGKF